MDRLTGKNNDYCFTVCSGERKHIREDCNIYKVCFERQIYERLKHYEDLAEAGRMLVLPPGITGKQLCKTVNTCPSVLGFKNYCGSGTCEDCWEAALKGGVVDG